MKLHGKGPKIGRDREICVQKYRELSTYFWWKKSATDEQLARLTPTGIYNLASDFYNALATKQKRQYAEHIGASQRSNPTSFGWFLHDLMRFSSRPRLWLIVSAPFRYPQFLKRVARRKATGAVA